MTDINIINLDAPFAVNWHTFEREFLTWRAAHVHLLQPTDIRIGGKNFMADEILGTWRYNGRIVELSAVHFPSMDWGTRGEINRFIGVTFADDKGKSLGGPIVSNFTELMEVLSNGPDDS